MTSESESQLQGTKPLQANKHREQGQERSVPSHLWLSQAVKLDHLAVCVYVRVKGQF